MTAPPLTALDGAGYLPLATGGGAFCLLHEPEGKPSGIGVVLVPPFGWDEVASHRARRAWAERLAQAGHAVLRLDLPGTGDSAGGWADAGLVARWIAAVDVAAREVRATPDVGRVAVVGLGLGGLLAAAAAASGAFEDLVVWGAPESGKAAIRRLRAFARLQRHRNPDAGADDSLEVSGFLLSAETLADVARLSVDAPGPTLRRALVLGASGVPDGAGALEGLRAAGLAVELRDGTGYDSMVDHPERVHLPLEVAERTAAWLAARQPTGPTESRAASTRTPGLRTAGFEELPVELTTPQGPLAGILTRPATGPRSETVALLLNAGAVRRTGPNRLWVAAAREAALAGVPSLRLDLPGIGDSPGDSARLSQVGSFYEPDRTAALRAVADSLAAADLGPRVAAIGLCAGGYHAFRLAQDDPRVTHAVLLNPGALVWDESLVTRLQAGKLARLRSRRSWGRVLRGGVAPAQVVASLRALPRAARTRRSGATPAVGPAAALDRLAPRRTRVLLAFSGEEPLATVLGAEGVLAGAGGRWPDLELATLPGTDHTLRATSAQRAALQLVAGVLAAANAG